MIPYATYHMTDVKNSIKFKKIKKISKSSQHGDGFLACNASIVRDDDFNS